MNGGKKLRQAVLYCVNPPNREQEAGIREFVRNTFGWDYVLKIIYDPSLKGGFRLESDGIVYDWTPSGRAAQLAETLAHIDKADSFESAVTLLKTGIEDFELLPVGSEVGKVTSAGDGIASISGLNNVAYGEIVVFESGVRGMVQDIRPTDIGCITFGDDRSISCGDKVVRTGKTAGIQAGADFLGRVVDALGSPVDGLGDIKADEYRPIEFPAPGIIDRNPVDTPLETGILAIDSMFPIGRGQRELIIGDRQTGKTAVALDTIINQKGKNVVCVYVAIGQKSSSVAQVVNTLRKRGAMDYTVVLTSPASDPEPMQYIAPYAGCALAEYFMYSGRDVLIVYDDLSKHAIAYRTLSLLLGRSPGREAYPGDVFYLHSRLLERSAHLSAEKGSGSMTALPIVETQAGDVSAYIPTNIISITDGQLFLESSLFFSGQRPAVNVGLSVSRVGGAAQTKAMKKAVGSIRLDLAQYREMEVFTQFSSDLDDNVKEQLNYGESLMMLLRQEQYRSLTLHEQVISLVTALNRVMRGIPKNEIKTFQEKMLGYFNKAFPDICDEIDRTGLLSPALSERIVKAATVFRETEYSPNEL